MVTVNITSACMYTLYVNGENMGQSYGGSEILKHSLHVAHAYDVVVAVRGFCYSDPTALYGSCHAFRASVSMCGTQVDTDGRHWLCTTQNSDPSWASDPSYDVSAWANASSVTCPGDADSWGPEPASLPISASWVWADPSTLPEDADTSSRYSSSYCRLLLPNHCRLCPGHTSAPTSISLAQQSITPSPTPAPSPATPAPTPCVADRNLYLTATSTCDYTIYINDQIYPYALANQISTYVYQVCATACLLDIHEHRAPYLTRHPIPMCCLIFSPFGDGVDDGRVVVRAGHHGPVHRDTAARGDERPAGQPHLLQPPQAHRRHVALRQFGERGAGLDGAQL